MNEQSEQMVSIINIKDAWTEKDLPRSQRQTDDLKDIDQNDICLSAHNPFRGISHSLEHMSLFFF
jgi:hypothetical protein